MLYHVTSASVDGNVLLLEFREAGPRAFDLAPLSMRGGLYSGLRDPEIRRTAHVSSNGRWVEFANGLEFCADQLWQDSVPSQAVARGATG